MMINVGAAYMYHVTIIYFAQKMENTKSFLMYTMA